VAVTVQGADQGDTATSQKTLIEAAEQIEAVVADSQGPKEVVADKGYHSNQVMVDLEAVGVRSYISEPDRGGETGGTTPKHKMPYTVTAGGFVASGESACSVNAGNFSSGPLPVCTKPERCGVSTCEVIRTSSSASCFMRRQ
jgi:hypothetical protein